MLVIVAIATSMFYTKSKVLSKPGDTNSISNSVSSTSFIDIPSPSRNSGKCSSARVGRGKRSVTENS